MTTYISSLTLPSFVFENPAVSILLPLVCGTATGFAISREFFFHRAGAIVKSSNIENSKCVSDSIPYIEAASSASARLCLRPGLDSIVCNHGLHGLPRIHHWHILLEP